MGVLQDMLLLAIYAFLDNANKPRIDILSGPFTIYRINIQPHNMSPITVFIGKMRKTKNYKH